MHTFQLTRTSGAAYAVYETGDPRVEHIDLVHRSTYLNRTIDKIRKVSAISFEQLDEFLVFCGSLGQVVLMPVEKFDPEKPSSGFIDPPFDFEIEEYDTYRE